MSKASKGGRLDQFFGVTKIGSNMKTEFMAGITSFVTIAYALIANPGIVGGVVTENADAIKNGVFIATCLGAFIGTFLCGVYAKVPFVQASGMGLISFFAYSVIAGMGYSYGGALAIVLVSGIICVILTVTGVRTNMVTAIPDSVKSAMTAGIGLFITIIGMKSAGIVVANAGTLVSLANFAAWKDGADLATTVFPPIVAIVGLIVMAALQVKKITGNILIGIVVATIVGIPLGVTSFTNFDMNIGQKFVDFANVSFLAVDFTDMMKNGIFPVIILVISFLLVTIFDSLGTLLGACKQAGLVDENGNALYMKESMMCDSIATVAGACCGISTVATVVECGAGIAAGGRTGMSSLTTALCFLAAIVLAPVIAIIPSAATAPAMIYVGVLMMGSIKGIDFDNMENALPAFCTIVFMPFTYSIANGVAFGLLTDILIKLFTGKVKKIHPLCVIIVIVFIIRFAFLAG
ncbi:MAG: NCS2 family permease [Oscillospiraceae bacterium]|nr:NCS2 family permease [Oscillospiraceae bacterium]